MSGSILVAYATKHGSTREVADAIAATLEHEGFDTHVQPAADVQRLEPYAGVVLGAALYMGRAHADARRFLAHHHEALRAIPFAVFGMGPLTTGADDVAGARKQLDHALQAVADVIPVSTAIFGGVVKPGELHFPFSHMKATDARDWPSIDQWTSELARLLKTRIPSPASTR